MKHGVPAAAEAIAFRLPVAVLDQDALLGFGLRALTGDVAGSSELFLGLPVLLTQLGCSRRFEREADRYTSP